MQAIDGHTKPFGASSPRVLSQELPPIPGSDQIWGGLPQSNSALRMPGMQLSLHAALPGAATEKAAAPRLREPPQVPSPQPVNGGEQTLLWVPWVVPRGTEADVINGLAAKVDALTSCRSNELALDLALSRQSTTDTGSTPLGWKSPPAYVAGVASLSQQSQSESDELEIAERKKAAEEVKEPPPIPKHMLRNKFHKTRLCVYFESGSCHKGTHCNFAHGGADMQPLPDLHRTKLCTTLLQYGICNEINCTFAHSQEELRGYSRDGQRHVSFVDEPDNTMTQHCAPPGTFQGGFGQGEPPPPEPDNDDDDSSLHSGCDDDDLQGATSGWGRQCTEDPSLAAVRMLRVKNTFLDVEDDLPAAPPVRRSNSAPCLLAFPLEMRAKAGSKDQQQRQEALWPQDGAQSYEPSFVEPVPAAMQSYQPSFLEPICPPSIFRRSVDYFNAGEPAIIMASV